MTGRLQMTIPQRLSWIRITVTLSLVISFFLSGGLWTSSALFPDAPLFRHLRLDSPFDIILTGLSIISLLVSMFAEKRRAFIFLSLLINIFLVMCDMNRLQAWFYIYNAVLLVMLFYNGRVDNPGKYTSTFTIIQMIIAAVYIFNGIDQLNPNFISTDFYDVISPVSSISSERQFAFMLKAGAFVPYFLIFIGVGLLIQPVRYLAIFCAWVFHLLMFILLFPSPKNDHYSLWFMNIAFAALLLFLFSGKPRERYFSWTLLVQKPMFYLVLLAFWVAPLASRLNYWPKAPTASFLCGKSAFQKTSISRQAYAQLPFYLRHFCSEKEEGYELRIADWCRHELKSEYTSGPFFNKSFESGILQLTQSNVKETEDELSSL
jgi:hypothetical protein